MKKLYVILLCIVVLCLFFFAGIQAAEVSSSWEALGLFNNSADYNYLVKKCNDNEGGVSELGNNPFYTLTETLKCPAPVGGIYIFHLDPKSGKIWPEPETQNKINALRETDAELLASAKVRSSEEAIKLFSSSPDASYISMKCGTGSGSMTEPREKPWYEYTYTTRECSPPAGGTYVFFLDPQIGNIWPDAQTQEKLNLLREADVAQARLLESERPLKEELDKAEAEIDSRRMYNDDVYRQIIQKHTPLFIKALGVATSDIRSHTAHILGQLSNQGYFGQYKITEAIPQLVMLLKDEDYGARYEAAWALGNIGARGDKTLVESILPLMDDSDSLVRRGAIEALGKLGDNSLVPRFIGLLEDMAVNQEIVKALAYIGDERAVEPLIRLLNSKKYFYFLERDAIDTLGAIRNKQGIPALVNLFNQEYTRNEKLHEEFQPRVPYMGADAARALIKIGKDAIPNLIELLKSQDYLQRLYSVYALGLFKDPVCLEALNAALKVEENPTVKTYIEWAIAETKGEKFVSSLLGQLKIEVKPSQKKYKLNSEINACVYINNVGKYPVVINNIPLQFVEVSFVVFAPGNQPALYIGPMYDWDPFPVQDNLVTLKAGQDYKGKTFNLGEFYKFDKSGIYKIIGVYSNSFYCCGIEFGTYALTGTVQSEPIEVEIE